MGTPAVRMIAASLALTAAALTACGSDPEPRRTVSVDIELQAINANAYSWGRGIAGGRGELGNGYIDETDTSTFLAKVGDPVFCKALATHWDTNDPAHQLICRIIVDGEEIYMCADQGSPNEDTDVECGGPVYLPQEEDR